ncbi:MAG: hypothetical protein EOO99_10150 [Pedobacter sp.]|nr:MAG: hypothetical protein EOO99_10150 [Pedobacter sp.]
MLKKSILTCSFLVLLVAGIASPPFPGLMNSTSHYRPMAQPTPQLVTFLKVWGFLKYFHPTIAQGHIDWDETFLKGIQDIQKFNNKAEINNYYKDLIASLGPVPKCRNYKIQNPDLKVYQADMGWLTDTTQFDTEVKSKLHYIAENPYQKEHYYVGKSKGVGNPIFKNEKVYKDSIYPSQAMRLLTLARYWNMVNYYFPYRYQTNQNWLDVLTEMTPKFMHAADTTAYHLAIQELTVKVDDSHAKFNTPYTSRYFGINWPPFKYEIIDQKAVVTGYYNDSLSQAHNIQIGDVIEELNGKPIQTHLLEIGKYIGASNNSVKNRDAHTILFHSNQTQVTISVERNGKRFKNTIPQIPFSKLGYQWGQDNPTDTIKLIADNIGYVHMGNLTIKQVPQLIQKLKHTQAIIFDVRNYPKSTLYHLANFLNPKPLPFVKFTETDPRKPGTFKFKKYQLYAGKNNKDYYRGKVILLANEYTQSHAEFTLMALQTAPNVTLIGSQTSGADGNVSLITLPGNYSTYITGLGVFYPDGRPTQKIGILPDIVVKPSIQGIREGRDEVLEKAIAFINNTQGVLDVSNMHFVKSPCNLFELGYTISKSKRLPYFPIDDIGIQPDYFFDEKVPDYEWVSYINDILNGNYNPKYL